MSDNDPTKDIGEKFGTKPTLETVVEMIAALRDHIDTRFNALESRVDALEILFDRTVSVIHETRADVREIKQGLKVTEPR